jgi:hypothetical protein
VLKRKVSVLAEYINLHSCLPTISNTILNNLFRSNTLSVYFLAFHCFFSHSFNAVFFIVLFVYFFIPFFLFVPFIKIRNSGVVAQASTCSSISTICENWLYVRTKIPYSFISVPNFYPNPILISSESLKYLKFLVSVY